MAEQIARYKPGENVAVFAQTQILAGRFVAVSGKDARGAYIGNHSGSGIRAFGVAEQDSAPASFPAHATERMVNVTRRGAVAMVEAGAAVAAGDLVMSDASGRAVTYVAPTIDPTATTAQSVPPEPAPLGRALTAAAGAGSIIEVDLF